MNKKTKRVATQIHTRKLDRSVAKNNMQKRGITGINKKTAGKSFFSRAWREYIEN